VAPGLPRDRTIITARGGAPGPCRRVEAVGRSVWWRVVASPLTHASHHRPTLVHLSCFRISPILTHSRFRHSSSRFSSRSSSRFRRFLFPEQSKAFQTFLMARGHISASFHLQRSNKGPLERSRQGAHDRAIISDFIKYDPGRVFRPTMCNTCIGLGMLKWPLCKKRPLLVGFRVQTRGPKTRTPCPRLSFGTPFVP
jgi:hypothetical protein